MPKIVKSHGVKMSEEVFRIRDAAKVKRVVADENNKNPDVGDASLSDNFENEAGNDFEDVNFSYANMEIETEIIQKAMEQASRIIEEAVAKAEEERQSVLLKAQYEADRMRNDARERGRQEAYAQSVDQIKEIAQNMEDLIASIEGDRAGFEAEYEEQLKWFSAEIASKVLAKKVSENDSVLLDMVGKTIQSVQNEPWVKVSVAETMVGLIGQLQEAYRQAANVEVNAIAAEEGTIQVETPSGIIDASLETQLENLKMYFSTGEGV